LRCFVNAHEERIAPEAVLSYNRMARILRNRRQRSPEQ
jgi:hypothetical protein